MAALIYTKALKTGSGIVFPHSQFHPVKGATGRRESTVEGLLAGGRCYMSEHDRSQILIYESLRKQRSDREAGWR
jgi:hypothetical protein